MAIIFSASADSKSGQHSSRLIAPLLRWLKPDISDGTVDRVVFVARKTAHVTEYGILSILLWRALRKPERGQRQPWRWSNAVLALVITAVYCASDELHQAFVPNREASFGDVALDTLGGTLGLGVIWVLGRWRKRW